MLVASRVEEIVAVVMDEYYDKVIARLAVEGIFHIDNPPTDVKGEIDREYVRAFSQASEYASRLDNFFKVLGVQPDPVSGVKLRVSKWVESFKEVIDSYKEIHEEYEKGVARLTQIESQLSELEALKAVLSLIKHIDADLRAAIEASRIGFAVGFLNSRALEALKELASKHMIILAYEEISDDQLIIAIAGSYGTLRNVIPRLSQFGWSPISIPRELPGTPSEAYKEITNTIEKLIRESDNIRSNLLDLTKLRGLREYYTKIMAFKELFKFLSNTLKTKTTRIFRGFIDVKDRKRLERLLMEETGGAFIILSLGVKRAAGKSPTKITLPGPLKVFHNIVEMYGEPDPDEIVPTLFLAITLPITFALMFPDAGHGLAVLLFALLYVMPRNRDWGTIIAVLGSSSIISGILAGEVFGPLVSKSIGMHKLWESLGFETPPLAQPTIAAEIYPPGPERTLHSVALLYNSITIAMWIGGFMLTLGSLLGVIDAILKGNKLEAILLKAPRFLFFAAVTSPFLVYFDVSKAGGTIRAALLEQDLTSPVAAFLYYGSILGLSWLLAGNIIEAIIHRESLLSGLGHGLLEVYENLLMAIGNIPSFLRIMALSLAHSSLMLGFAELYHVIADGGGIVMMMLGALVYIVGNLQ
ncbi:MAG: hypothetical protein GSR85_12040 [Desulfurococcales archaeon]|nr:hypothetical protein [Desulfurococcales archaeon]